MPVHLHTSLEDLVTRAAETRAVQDEIQTVWIWTGASVAQWDAWLRDFDPAAVAAVGPPQVFDSLARKVSIARTAVNNADQAVRLLLAQLKVTISTTVADFRGKAVTNPTLREYFDELSASGTSPGKITEEADELIIAWEDFDVNYTPGSPHNLTDFKNSLALLPGLMKTWKKAKATLRRAEASLMNHALFVQDQCVAWYMSATGRFDETTTEGQTIRNRIPTSYSPPGTITPGTPTGLTAQALGSNRVLVDCADTAGATRYHFYGKGPGETEFTLRADPLISEALLSGLAPGVWEIRVTAINSAGESTPSAPVQVTVT